MLKYIDQYVNTYNLYLYTKLIHWLPLGKLYLLLLLNVRWKTISIDFIVELPNSIGFDIVITVIYSVSKRTHFISIHITVTVKGSVRLFLHNV